MFRVSFQPYSRSFAIPLTTAHGVWSIREGIIIALIDEQGRVGLGEIAPLPWFGSETMADAIAFCAGLGGVIEDWRDVPDGLPCCQFAFEMAGRPSPPLREKMRTRMDIAGLLPTGPDALTQWEGLYATGTRSFKWKIGTAPVATELALFKQLCDRLPTDVSLRLDANGVLTFEEAQQWLEECDRQPCIEFLEQPLGIDHWDELLTLSQHFSTLLALDESIANYQQLEDYYDRGWRDVFVVKPAIAGYPSRLQKFCDQHSIDVVFSSVFESAIGFQNALQVATAIGSSRALGFGTARYFEGIEPINSTLILEKDPGEFLVKFWSAIASNHHLFLGNPNSHPTEIPQTSQTQTSQTQTSQKIHIPTGGTSGAIKFATHTLQTLTASIQGMQQHFQTPQIHSLCTLPLHHVSGLMQHLRSHHTNGQLIIWDWKQLETGNFPAIELEKFYLSLVPTQLQRLIHRPELTRFKAILLGGAPAWDSLLDTARHHQLPIALTYGMTETASQIATLKPEEFLRGLTSVGKPLPHVKIEIRDDRGNLCQPNTIGHLHIYTKSRMLGYAPNLDTETGFKPDDLGYLDSDGYLHIVGRSSDKIITGGENVFPSEVESAILATGQVQDVCVMGLDDDLWGQRIVAVYVPIESSLNPNNPNNPNNPDLGTSIASYKRPKHWIGLNRIPRNAQGKVDRTQLLQIIQSHLT